MGCGWGSEREGGGYRGLRYDGVDHGLQREPAAVDLLSNVRSTAVSRRERERKREGEGDGRDLVLVPHLCRVFAEALSLHTKLARLCGERGRERGEENRA